MSGSLYTLRFNPFKDLSFLNEWLMERGLPEETAESLAGMGFTVWDNRKEEPHMPVVCGFLRRCEGNWGIIDGLCSNPALPGHLRHEAIDMVIERLIEKAASYRMKHLLAWSIDKGTLVRSERHGFERSPYVLITKSLSSLEE